MPLCGRNWADSICWIVVSTSCPNSRRCSAGIVVCRYWISTRRLRTKTTCDFGNASNPGIANQLRVKSQQSVWLFRETAGSCLPFEQSAAVVQPSEGVDVCHELV